MTQQFTCQLTEPIYLAANRLNFWEWTKSVKSLRFIGWIGLFYAVLGGTIAFADGMDPNLTNVAMIAGIALLAGVAVLSVCLGLGYVLIPYRTRKLLAQQKLHLLPIQYEVHDDELSWKNELMDTRIPYSMVHKWSENDEIFLVYHSDITFNVIPKRIAGPQVIDDLRSGLQRAGIAGRSL